MSSQELNDWTAYYALEADLQAAVATGMDPALAVAAVWAPPED